MDGIFGIIGIFALGCGVYCIYAYVNMRKTGQINATLLLGKDQSEKSCRNKVGFMKKACPAVLVLGVLTIIFGVIDTVHNFVIPLGTVDVVAVWAFVAVLIGYMVYINKLKKDYF